MNRRSRSGDIFAGVLKRTNDMRHPELSGGHEGSLLEEILVENGPVHEIILHNDDLNTFDHVINCLMEICDHDPIQAEQCAWIVHNNGKCSVKRGPFHVLEPQCTALLDRGLSAAIDRT